MRTKRFVLWGSATVAVGVLLLIDVADVYPEWLVVGPVCLGVMGVALLADQIAFAPGRGWGFFASLMMIALSAGTVAQDAELVVDEWAIWPFVAGALVLGIPLEAYAARVRRSSAGTYGRRIGPSAGAKAA